MNKMIRFSIRGATEAGIASLSSPLSLRAAG
jgi:hypothetical protein